MNPIERIQELKDLTSYGDGGKYQIKGWKEALESVQELLDKEKKECLDYETELFLDTGASTISGRNEQMLDQDFLIEHYNKLKQEISKWQEELKC